MTRRYLRLTGAFALLLAGAGVLRAEPTAEQLKAMYEDSQRQLQQSQDRKNQLANENEQLHAQLAALEAKLNAITVQAEQAQFLRNQAAIWASFMQEYPTLLKRFETYVTGESGVRQSIPQSGPVAVPFFDPHWPFSAVSDIGQGV